jgi:hypothetical protein
MNSSGSSSALLTQAWRLRMNQHNDRVRDLWLKIQGTLGVPAKATWEERVRWLSDAPDDEKLDALLLAASLERLEGKDSEFEAAVSRIEAFCLESGRALPFHLLFEKGLLCHVRGDYSAGLDLFTRAKQAASEPADKIYSQLNAILCLENLGVPFEAARQELCRTLAALDPSEYPGVRAQAEGLEMRGHFREGRPAQALSVRLTNPTAQPGFFRLWISELPFHSARNLCSAAEKEAFFLSAPFAPLKAYRLRTLQGVVHAKDLDEFRPPEFADRFYLWVWRWICDAKTAPLEPILALIRQQDLLSLGRRFTVEDFQLVRNGLLWMALFSESPPQGLESLLDALKPAYAADYPIFSLEELLIRYLLSRKAGERPGLETLASHPLWESPELHFRQIALSLDDKTVGAPKPLEPLCRSIRALLPRPRENRDCLYVDLVSHRVQPPGDSSAVVSEALARALRLFATTESVSFPQAAQECFGLTRYDETTHAPKVYNLLARAKPVLPKGVRVFVKSGIVHSEGSWKSVEFRLPHPMSALLDRHEVWQSLLAFEETPKESAPQPPKAVSAKDILSQIDGAVTREQLEKLTQLSRSSATRLIARWVDQGKLERVGKGKKTRYFAKPLS